MNYYFDWYRLVCSNCGTDITFPMSPVFESASLAVQMAKEVHEFNRHFACKQSNIVIEIVEKDKRLDVNG